MVVSSVSICGLLLILNLQLSTSFPVLRDTDVDMLKVSERKMKISEDQTPIVADHLLVWVLC